MKLPKRRKWYRKTHRSTSVSKIQCRWHQQLLPNHSGHRLWSSTRNIQDHSHHWTPAGMGSQHNTPYCTGQQNSWISGEITSNHWNQARLVNFRPKTQQRFTLPHNDGKRPRQNKHQQSIRLNGTIHKTQWENVKNAPVVKPPKKNTCCLTFLCLIRLHQTDQKTNTEISTFGVYQWTIPN